MKFILYMLLLHKSFGFYNSMNINMHKLLKISSSSSLYSQNKNINVIENEKICKDCKFFIKHFLAEPKFGHCSKFPTEPTNNYLVDGISSLQTGYYYCSTARFSEKMCGREGKYFEIKK